MNHLFITGAQRSGSTYLYHILDEHPKISMSRPVRPEPKFFLDDQLYAKGHAYYENAYFSGHSKETRYLGEKSTSYIESVVAANRIHQFYPNARILMILRDPVIRAYSNYRFSAAHQLEDLTFEDALKAEPIRLADASFSTSVNPYAYCKRGHYIDYIETYLTIFDRSQLEILIFEELVCKPESVQRLYRWLGVDDDFKPDSFGKIYNPTVQKEQDHSKTFRSLALGYRESLEQLENLLGHRIETWRRHWDKL
ncbi:MAG: sulfotransferase [Methylobacter sp.]|uniref:sulfotransferase family protein n=1 Tax=Methylobacter sp. TaxID=2051955 RepID=UPI00273017C2|nr:sulfotransferase [Methylobacter sp.]MDP1665875.1 sulfotransferase [Methylobacter sp.]